MMEGYDNYVIFAGNNKLRIEGDEIVVFEPKVNTVEELFAMMDDTITQLALKVRELEVELYNLKK